MVTHLLVAGQSQDLRINSSSNSHVLAYLITVPCLKAYGSTSAWSGAPSTSSSLGSTPQSNPLQPALHVATISPKMLSPLLVPSTPRT